MLRGSRRRILGGLRKLQFHRSSASIPLKGLAELHDRGQVHVYLVCELLDEHTKYDRRRELDIQDIHVRSSGTNFLQGRVRRTPQSVVELPDDGREGALVENVRSLGEGHMRAAANF